MLDNGVQKAADHLSTFVGKILASCSFDQLRSRFVFEGDSEFVTDSPWRLMRDDAILFGSGDFGATGMEIDKHLESLKGLRVVSTSVSHSCDTRLLLEKVFAVEIIPNSARYEIWEARIETGWVIFMGGEVTVFPPPTRAVPPPTDAR
jgi:hypothetical protein